MEYFIGLSTLEKQKIQKSFHWVEEILPLTHDEMPKVTSIPRKDLTAKEVVGNFPSYCPTGILLHVSNFNSFCEIAPPLVVSSEAAIVKLNRKWIRLKGVGDNIKAKVPPPTGMDNIIAPHERAKHQNKSKSS